MNLIFRRTRQTDVAETFRMRARTRQNPASPAFLATLGITEASVTAQLESDQIKGWVCFHDSTLVGFCSGDTTTGEVLVLAVLAGYEGKGIGRRLLSDTVECLRESGFERPWLAASPDPDIRAHGFYRSLGWKPTGRALDNGDEILELSPE